MRLRQLAATAIVCWCLPLAAVTARQASPRYVVTWAGDADRADSDFLAVIDAREDAATYGHIVTTVPVGARATYPHHTEHSFTPGFPFFVNGSGTNQTFRFDLSDPLRPRLLGDVTTNGPLAYPHDFERLPNGNVLATMQASTYPGFEGPGGLAEIDNQGRVVRTSSAGVDGISPNGIRPYGLAVIPQADRVVTASNRMGLTPWDPDRDRNRDPQEGYHVQLWRLSDLALLKTITLPAAAGTDAHRAPAEPRVLADGTVVISTFRCGLYRIGGLEPDTFRGEFVYWHAAPQCGGGLVVGHYWLQTIPVPAKVVVLDLRNPSAPLHISELPFDSAQGPHWLAADSTGRRILMTNGPARPDRRIWMLRFDPLNGRLSVDERFRQPGTDRPGISFDRAEWPHGATGDAVPHGTVFVP